VVQVSIFVLANVLALVLRWIPDYAAVSPALHVMSVLFLLDLPGELRTKMLQRALDWRRLRLLHGAALLVGSALSIGMALDGWGLYALLVPTLIVPLPFICDLFVGLRWRPTWAWDWGRFRPAYRFGTSRILALSFVSAAVLLESSWLAGALGFAVLGVFGRAVRLAELLCGRLAGLLATSVYPVLTRIQPRTDQYRRASAMYLRSIAWVVLPVGGAAMLMAGPLVRTLYGGQWLEVIPVLPWAVAVGALTAMVQTGYTLLLAHQRQDRCLLADVWRLIGTTAALVGLLGFGLEAYLAGLAAVHVVALAMVLAWLRADDAVTNRGLSQALLPPVVGVLVGVAAALIVGPLGGEREPWRMVVQASLFAGSYALVLRFGFRKQLRELVAQLPEQRRISRWLGLQEAT
jgi:PST family polysaccharide transporter